MDNKEVDSNLSPSRQRVQHVGDGDYVMTPTKALAVAAMKQKRDQEKQVLNQLNDRFSKYIERVKFLESQNKRLLSELDEMRVRWGEESRIIRERYEPELTEARATIDDTTREKAVSEIRAKRTEYEVASLKRQFEDTLALMHDDKNKMGQLEYVLQENTIELDLLRRQMSDVESDLLKYKREVVRLNDELQRLLAELDQETLKRVKLENERQTLEEQIPFLNAIHEQEMAELRSMHQASSHIDPAQFYRHELERAIRDIRNDFEELSETQKRELEEYYKAKADEIVQKYQQKQQPEHTDSLAILDSLESLRLTCNDNQKEYNDQKQRQHELVLRLGHLEERLDQARRKNMYDVDEHDREIGELRARLEETMMDYDDLVNSKASLEFEITTYRRLLDSEEGRKDSDLPFKLGNNNHLPYMSGVNTSRYTSKHRSNFKRTNPNLVDHAQSPKYNIINLQLIEDTQPTKEPLNLNELSTKTTYQRSAKGPVSISECSPDGKVIILENTSRNKDVNLSNWIIKRTLVDENEEIEYSFPSSLVLKANKTLRIWSNGHGKDNWPYDLVNASINNWGISSNIVTIVCTESREEKARHIQKTVYANGADINKHQNR